MSARSERKDYSVRRKARVQLPNNPRGAPHIQAWGRRGDSPTLRMDDPARGVNLSRPVGVGGAFG